MLEVTATVGDGLVVFTVPAGASAGVVDKLEPDVDAVISGESGAVGAFTAIVEDAPVVFNVPAGASAGAIDKLELGVDAVLSGESGVVGVMVRTVVWAAGGAPA